MCMQKSLFRGSISGHLTGQKISAQGQMLFVSLNWLSGAVTLFEDIKLTNLFNSHHYFEIHVVPHLLFKLFCKSNVSKFDHRASCLIRRIAEIINPIWNLEAK